MRVVWFAACVFWAAAAFGAAASEKQFTGEIVIGATLPRTGFLEDYGLSAFYGAMTCVRKINENGGINGKRLVVEWRDNGSSPETAAADIRELVERHHVPAVIGPLMSDSVMMIKPLARELGVVVISPMATLDAIPEPDPWVFRACFNNSTEARALTRFQRDKFGAQTCAILYDSRYSFSREMTGIFEKAIAEIGGSSIGKYDLINSEGQKDYVTPLQAIAEKKPDYIFAPCYALEATEMIQAARDLAVDIQFCGHYTWDNELVFDGAGTRLAGTSFASALFEQAFSRTFRVFFNAMEEAGMDNPDASSASAYDAVTLLAHALEQGETPEAVRQALLKVNNMILATGRFSITPDGDTVKPVLVRVVERRDWRLVPIFAERYDPPRRRAKK